MPPSALGPIYGVGVCLVKNLLHLMITSTGGAGELCNFLLGVFFVVPAGLIYRKLLKSRKGAVLGALRRGCHYGIAVHSPKLLYLLSRLLQILWPIDAILNLYQ